MPMTLSSPGEVSRCWARRAALPLTPGVRFADLDGPTWLAVDAEPALQFDGGTLHL